MARRGWLAGGALATVLIVGLWSSSLIVGAPNPQANPTEQQQTIDAIIQQRFQQTAVLQQQLGATETIDAAYIQALTATAGFDATLNAAFAQALTATAAPPLTQLASTNDVIRVTQEFNSTQTAVQIPTLTSIANATAVAQFATASFAPITQNNVSGLKRLIQLSFSSGTITDLAFNSTGSLLAAASSDHTIALWDTATFNPLGVLTGNTAEVETIAFSPSGSILASGGADGTVRIWDVYSRSQVISLNFSSGAVTSLAFSSDGGKLAAAGVGLDIKVWNTGTFELSNNMQDQFYVNANARYVAINFENSTILDAAHGYAVNVFSLSQFNGEELTRDDYPGPDLVTAYCALNSLRIVAYGDELRIWHGHNMARFDISGIGSCRVLSPTLVVFVRNNGLSFWDIEQQSEISYLSGITEIAVNPEGRLIAAGDVSGKNVILLGIPTHSTSTALDETDQSSSSTPLTSQSPLTDTLSLLNVAPTPTPVRMSSLTAIVTTDHLNVRRGPGPEYDSIMELSSGTLINIIGRNVEATWIQLDTADQQWVNARYTSLEGNVTDLPVTFQELGDWGVAGTPTGIQAVTESVMRIRGGPGSQYRQLSDPDTVKSGVVLDVIGQNEDGSWYQVNIAGRSGWISAQYVHVTGTSTSGIPIASPNVEYLGGEG